MFPCYQRCLLPASLGFALSSCGSPDFPVPIESDAPIHLEDHLESARVDSTPPPTHLPGQRDWTFEGDVAGWNPFAVHSVNELYPRRVERYEALLRRQWMAHRALGRQFQSAKAEPWTPEEIRALRALGYVR